MKSDLIINSWGRVCLDKAADERIRDKILAYNHSKSNERKPFLSVNNLVKVLAACFIICIGFVYFLSEKPIVSEIGGDTLTFYSGGKTSESVFAWDSDWDVIINRDLTDNEKRLIFGNLAIMSNTGNATFRSSDNAFMHFEGKSGNTRIIVSANGHGLTDTIIEGNEHRSTVNGVSVNAGYLIAKPNSRGEKRIIYYAFFENNNMQYYAEIAGFLSDSDSLRAEISNVVGELTLL
jgi:hypothetical protein